MADQQDSAYIVSFPKAGRTWLRFLIGAALRPDPDSGPTLLETFTITRASGACPTRLTHDGSSIRKARTADELRGSKERFAEARVLLLSRNPCDLMVSGFFQATRRRRCFDGTLSDFVRDPRFGAEKCATFYSHWRLCRGQPRAFLEISYEELHADTAATLRRVLEFIRAPTIAPVRIERAVNLSSFDRMRKIEERGELDDWRMQPGDSGDPESYKTRRGLVGGWVDYLSAEDREYIEACVRNVATGFGQ